MIGAFAAGNYIIVTIGARCTGLVMGKRQDKIIPARAGGVTQLAGVGGVGVRCGFVTGIRTGMARHTAIGGLIVWKWDD